MNPIGNQPARPNPQQPPVNPPANPAPVVPTATPTPTQQVPPLEPSRPAPVTQNIAPIPERPVEAWPPAGTPAAQEVAKAQSSPVESVVPSSSSPTQEEIQVVGIEATEAATFNTVAQPTPPPSPGGMDGFVSPAAKEIKDSVNANQSASETPMSDQQADKLFQEEPATKERNKRGRTKKILLTLLAIVVLGLLAGGAYVYFFGNKAAQSYSSTSSVAAYKEAFSQIQSSLSEQPVNTAELEAGFNKLKVAQDNSKSLSPVILGQLNPNYKKAQQSGQEEKAYREKAEAYQEEYTDYTDYLGALSSSFETTSKLDELPSVDLTTTPADKLSTDLGALLTECSTSVKTLAEVTKPGELSEATAALSKNLALICTEGPGSLEDGAIVFLSGKTGVLSAADQEQLKAQLTVFANTSSTIATKEGSTFELEKLSGYQQSALDQAKTLQQEAEALSN